MQKKISFILPIYGTETDVFKEGLVRLNQLTDSEYEFLLVSDGARSELIAICQEFVTLDARFKLIQQDNQGVSVARNTGISYATGRWLFFVDPDDLIVTDFEQVVADKMDSEADIIFFEFDRIFSDGQVEKVFRKAELFPNKEFSNSDLIRATLSDGSYYNGIYGYYLGTPWAKMFKTSFIRNNALLYPEKVIKREDALFSVECFLKQPKIEVVNRLIYHYRIDHDNSISNSYRKGVKQSFISVLERLNLLLKEWVENSDNQSYLSSYAIRITIELLFADFCNPNNTKDYAERKHNFLVYITNPAVKQQIKKASLSNMPIKQKVLGFLIKQHWFKALDYLLYKRKRG